LTVHNRAGFILIRALLVLSTLTWWVLPGFGIIDLTVTWDPEWPVMLEAGWGLMFTIGVGLPFLVTAIRPSLARAALAQLYVVTAALVAGTVAGLEWQSWWIFVMLLLEVPLIFAIAPSTRLRRSRPHLALLALAVIAAPAALVYAWDMAYLNRLGLPNSDITNFVNHYAVQAALALALIALPAVAALWPDARRLLGTSAALMAGYLGLVSYYWPGADGGFSAGWSVAVMVWASAVLVATWWPGQRRSTPT
jgi:hypothetical protein